MAIIRTLSLRRPDLRLKQLTTASLDRRFEIVVASGALSKVLAAGARVVTMSYLTLFVIISRPAGIGMDIECSVNMPP